MRVIRTLFVAVVLLTACLLTIVAAMPPESPNSTRDSTTVAIAQPLATMEGAPLVMPQGRSRVLPESGMLVLVGSSLLALAALVRRSM